MLSVLPYFLSCLLLFYSYGFILFVFLKKAIPANPFKVMICGIALSGIISMIFWLGGAVNYFCLAVYITGALIGVLLNRENFLFEFAKFKDWLLIQSKFEIFLLFICLIPILYQSAQPSKIIDMYAYYMQTMEWMQTTGVVKGLANLHPALGLGSAWHSLTALLDPFLFGLGHKWQINGVLFFIFILFTWYESKISYSIFLNSIFIFSIPLGFLYLTAPSPDLPIILIGSLLFYWALLDANKIHWFILLIISIFLFASKPPALVAILMCIVTFFQLKNQKKKVVVFISIGVLLCSFILYKNYVLSGYLFYPNSKPDIIESTWKVPNDWNKVYTSGIISWGLNDKGDKQSISTSEISKNRFMTWIDRKGYKGFMNKLIFVNFIIGIILSTLVRKKNAHNSDFRLPNILLVLLIIEIIEWLILSQYRLMLPTALIVAALNFHFLKEFIAQKVYLKLKIPNIGFDKLLIGSIFLLSFMAFIPFSIFSKSSRNKTITTSEGFSNQYIIAPFVGFEQEVTDSVQSNNGYFYHYPNQLYCCKCKLPCVSLSHARYLEKNFGYSIKFLGNSKEEGFTMERIY